VSDTNIFTALTSVSSKAVILEGKAHVKEEGLVSVVIPNYNKGSYLRDCLSSILQQDYDKIEIIFIDDCSLDNSKEVAEDVLYGPTAQKLKGQGKLRVTLLALPRRVGTAWAQNIGFYLARGEFIANQDSDDISMHKRISRQVSFLKKNPDTSAVGSDYIQFAGSSNNLPNSDPLVPGCLNTWLAFDPNIIAASYEEKKHRVCWGTLMMRAEVIDLLGGNNKKYIGAEDFEIMYRMSVEHKLKINNLPEKLYGYRKSSTQRSSLFHSK
jgi:glycosyltransferase involved in cell wall biosynthesis